MTPCCLLYGALLDQSFDRLRRQEILFHENIFLGKKWPNSFASNILIMCLGVDCWYEVVKSRGLYIPNIPPQLPLLTFKSWRILVSWASQLCKPPILNSNWLRKAQRKLGDLEHVIGMSNVVMTNLVRLSRMLDT